MKTSTHTPSHPPLILTTLVLACVAGLSAVAAPSGPVPEVPSGGGPPGPFPNTAVSAVNVVARGSTTFNGNAEITGYEGNGPIPWTVTKYDRGDFAMRLSPANPSGANANTLNQGFTSFNAADNAALPENQSWRPRASLGVAIPTARQNGPVDWGDGEGPLYPTVAISAASSGRGYDMNDGSFGNFDALDINLGRAGTHGSSPEGNFGFSVAWFPYDAGWIGGNIGNPSDSLTGAPQWNGVREHAAGLTPGLMTWAIPPSPPGDGVSYGGLGTLRLPGVNALTNGMIFTTSSHGNSDVNIVGVAPMFDDGTGDSGWIVTVREDSALTADEVAASGQFQFEFVYVPYNANNLIGGRIEGATGNSLNSAGSFTLARTSAGTYELTVPGKAGTNGTLLLQVADLEPTATLPMASRAFLSYQYNSGSGKFVIQCRKATSDTASDLVDANFYFAWVDFANPLSPPEGPRLRNLDAVAVTDVNVVSASQANVAVNTDEPEVLVTTVDLVNSAGYLDPTMNSNLAVQAVIGYFYDPRTLTKTRGPFFIMGNAVAGFNKHDADYNPVSKEYVVVGRAVSHNSEGQAELMISRIKPHSVAGIDEPLVNVFTYDGLTNGSGYDDVSIAVSTKNGNFIVVAEHNVPGESGEAAFGAMFSSAGAVLTPTPNRLDLRPFSGAGDEDDPDVVYLPQKDVFLYVSNTDNDGWVNKIVGSVIQTTPSGGNLQISGQEQLLSTAAGTQGHPSSIENPFNGELITAYDAGNGTAVGNLTFFNIGAGPDLSILLGWSEIPYLSGAAPNPFRHQHPRLAADPDSGVILVAHQAYGSSIFLPNAYVFRVLDTEGAVMPSQLGVPYFLGDSGGQVETGPNDHNLVYDPITDSFIAVYTGNNPQGGYRTTYLASVTVTSDHLAPPPTLSIERSGGSVIIRWPASASGYVLKSAGNLTSATWTGPAGGTPVPEGELLKVTIPIGTNSFFRLEK